MERMKVAKVIGPFRGEHRWLSNFWPVQVEYEGMIFPSVEHAYQAAKCARLEDRETIRRAPSPAEAKRYGRKVQIRPGWDTMKLQVMEELLRQKFRPGSDLAKKLVATGNAELVEINTWGDTFWGVYNDTGQNWLGRLLMKIREELRTVQKPERPRLYTVNINLARELGLTYTDTTVKSGDRAFAPTWDMVMGHKEGRVSDDEYIRRYVDMMRRSYRENGGRWKALLGQQEAYLACYCRPGARFCHRYILAEILERLGAQIVGEVVERGALAPVPRLASGYLKSQKEVITQT